MVKQTGNDKASERILIAAKKVFLEKGMAGARMQDIADGAGINKALLHYYFRSKEKLFETIFNEASDQFFPKIVQIIDANIPLFEKIENFCAEYIDLMQENPYLPLFVLNEVNKEPQRFREKFWTNRERIFLHFAGQIELEIKMRHIRSISPAHLFMNMISMCIFPFVAKSIWLISSGMDELQFRHFMEQRKKEIPRFIIASIKK